MVNDNTFPTAFAEGFERVMEADPTRSLDSIQKVRSCLSIDLVGDYGRIPPSMRRRLQSSNPTPPGA